MGEETILEKIRDFISRVSFKIYLWSIQRTAEQYWNEIYLQEKAIEEL